ncbi:MAG: preprotein translocase subunit SecG [Clostridiales bacterium]|nr:preprotein translocase subunit SecG [Clostridiales bacterium]
MIIFLSIILAVDSIALVTLVLMQEGKSAGLGAISGIAESYYGKNKAHTMEGKMERLTRILAAVLIILSFIIYLLAA